MKCSPSNLYSEPSESEKPENQELFCEICGQTARGRHYGAVACRACAAFFRRSGTSVYIKKCKYQPKGGLCEFFKNGFFSCKTCRLEKCFEVGMTAEDFQFDRDSLKQNTEQNRQLVRRSKKIPPTMDTFLGRPNFIIFCAPSPSSPGSKNYLDVQFLLDKAMSIIDQGLETPVTSKSSLGKLAIGLKKIYAVKPPDPRLMSRFGKEETLANWEHEMLKVTKWLTYFDGFRELPQALQIQMLKGIWKVWNRLELVAISVIAARKELTQRQLENMQKDSILGDWSGMQIDLSWCSRLKLEELKCFIDIQTEIRYDDLFKMLFDLDPTDIELSYMMCQLCFHYVGKRYQGEILEVSERFLELIGNELHDYYVNEVRRPHYGGRLVEMMRINNRIQQDIYKTRSRRELALVFDVFNIDLSHPEMFEE